MIIIVYLYYYYNWFIKALKTSDLPVPRWKEGKQENAHFSFRSHLLYHCGLHFVLFPLSPAIFQICIYKLKAITIVSKFTVRWEETAQSFNTSYVTTTKVHGYCN